MPHMASRTMKDGLVFSLIILFQLSNTGSSASIIAEMKDFIFECFFARLRATVSETPRTQRS